MTKQKLIKEIPTPEFTVNAQTGKIAVEFNVGKGRYFIDLSEFAKEITVQAMSKAHQIRLQAIFESKQSKTKRKEAALEAIEKLHLDSDYAKSE